MFYKELTLIENDDRSFYSIWKQLYKYLHFALVDVRNKHGIKNIGVNFPNYEHQRIKREGMDNVSFSTLGGKLRIFANSTKELEVLNIEHWLKEISEYVHISNIKPVSDNVSRAVTVSRFKFKSMHRQAKDYAKYKNISYDEAMKHCVSHKKLKISDYPFIHMKSSGNYHSFDLAFVQKDSELDNNAKVGIFNTYGINSNGNKNALPIW